MASTTPVKTSSRWFEVNHVTYIMYVLKAAKKNLLFASPKLKQNTLSSLVKPPWKKAS